MTARSSSSTATRSSGPRPSGSVRVVREPLPYRFHPEAEAEFLAAIDWYAARDADVATDFAALARDAVQLMAELPQAWPTWPGREDLRVRVLRRFPFSIVYAVEAETIVVIAVAHHRRRPGYWLHRVPR